MLRFRPLLVALLVVAAPVPSRAADAPVDAPQRASARAYAAYLQGRLAERNGDWRAALAAYRTAVEADPRAPAPRIALAEARARAGDVAGAEAEARRAVALDPEGPTAAEAWVVVGRAAAVAGRRADAEAAFRSAIALQPPPARVDPQAWRLLAHLRAEAGDDAGAEQVLEELARRSPSDGGAGFRELARTLAERRQLDRAADLYRRAVALERRDLEAWRRLAELEESRRRFDVARAAWEGLVRQDPDDPEALVALGRLSLRTGGVDAARAYFSQAIHVAPDEAGARSRVGFAWLDARHPAEAIAVVEAGLRPTPDGRLLYVRGLALREERRWEEAAASFAGVNTGDADLDIAALAARASSLVQAGKGTAALTLVDSALAARPGDPRLVAARALVLERTGRAADAVRELRAALAASPRSDRLVHALALAEERAGNRAGAVTTMRRALELDPDDAEALNFIGYTLADMGEQLDEAQALVGRALAADPDNGSFLDSMGWVLLKRGDLPGAVATLEKAEAASGPEPTVLEHLGDAYRRSGRDADAARAWRRAVQVLDEGAEAERPDQRAAIERKLHELPGGDVRPARR